MSARPLALATLALLGLLAAPRTGAAPPSPPRNALGYRYAVAPYAFAFPRDHASHPSYQSEWWYYTGQLEGAGRRFGFELTFFRVGLDPARAASVSAWAPTAVLFAHLALTDEAGRKFRWDERIARPALGMAGADSTRYRVWIDDWSAELAPDGLTHRLRAPGATIGLALDLVPSKPAAIHGAGGVSRKSAGVPYASHYYSLSRLAASGRVRVGRDTLAVRGEAWMDHEFGSGSLAPGQRGWDWLGLQLDDGCELMLYVLRLEDGGIEPLSSGTWIGRDGRTRHLESGAFELRALRKWKSPKSGATYPSGWSVRVPSEGLDLTLEPMLADQELVTGGAAGVVYWEGAVRTSGRAQGREVRGRGYVELTGYAGRAPGL
jgi:predicted secreted hydrolase